MKRILIVDDEPNVAKAMKEIATNQGYEVIVRYDGVDALKLLKEELSKKEKFDVILTDYNMYPINGYDLGDIVNNLSSNNTEEYSNEHFDGNTKKYEKFVEKYKATAVLMMSKDTMSQDWFKGAGIKDCFKKSSDKENPFDEDNFIEFLHKYLD